MSALDGRFGGDRRMDAWFRTKLSHASQSIRFPYLQSSSAMMKLVDLGSLDDGYLCPTVRAHIDEQAVNLLHVRGQMPWLFAWRHFWLYLGFWNSAILDRCVTRIELCSVKCER
jgi:hypothetical protein